MLEFTTQSDSLRRPAGLRKYRLLQLQHQLHTFVRKLRLEADCEITAWPVNTRKWHYHQPIWSEMRGVHGAPLFRADEFKISYQSGHLQVTTLLSV